jgi:hypothetical protein
VVYDSVCAAVVAVVEAQRLASIVLQDGQAARVIADLDALR